MEALVRGAIVASFCSVAIRAYFTCIPDQDSTTGRVRLVGPTVLLRGPSLKRERECRPMKDVEMRRM